MDDHQRKMWNRMLDRLDAIESGEINLTALAQDLRGLFVEAGPHSVGLRDGFEVRWSELDMNNELRAEPWAPQGSYDPTRVSRGIEALREWITTSVPSTGSHGKERA